MTTHTEDLATTSRVDRAHNAYLLGEVCDLESALGADAFGTLDPPFGNLFTTSRHYSPSAFRISSMGSAGTT